MIGRLEPEEAPALDVPKWLPARIEWRDADLVGLEHVSKVATQPLVAETGSYVLVPGEEPAVSLRVVEDRGALAQDLQSRIGIREEPWVRGVEPDRSTRGHRLTIGCRRPS